MKKIWVKFLKDYEKHKKDEVVQLDEAEGNSLVTLKIAETTAAPSEDEITKKALEGLTDSITKTVEAGIVKGIEALNKNLKTRIPIVTVRDGEKDPTGGFKSAGEFFNCVIRACNPNRKDIDARLIPDLDQKGVPSGMNTRDDTEGGYLIPEQTLKEIWEFTKEPDNIFSRCDNRQTSGQSLRFNGMPEQSRKDGYRDGGALGYWLAEADQYTASQLKWHRVRLELHKLGVLMYVTDEELADSEYALGPIMTRKASNAINFLLNEAFIWGTGVGKPLGVMNCPALIEVGLESNQDPDTILHKNINKMYHRMHPRLRSGAVWFVHPDLEENLEYINFHATGTDPANTNAAPPFPIYFPPGGLKETNFGILKGRPVVPLEYMREFGRRGDILFANFSQYATLTKPGGGIQYATSMHVRFLFDEQAFKWTMRIDGQSLWPYAIEDYNGNNTRSPFVTLADRSGDSSSSGL